MTPQPLRSVLAFDTATEHMSIALAVGDEVRTHEAPGGARASATLVPAILALLADAGLALRDLEAIAFGRGPGAFTGLRTACAVAQGLAFAVAKPVLPIDSLLAVAEDARQGDGEQTIWVAMDARMNEVYAACYRFDGGFDGTAWQVLAAPMLIGPDRLNARWQAEPPAHVAGNALTAFDGVLQAGAARRSDAALPRGRAMLPLARALWAQGGAVDAAAALPFYLRDKVAQTTAERDAVRAARRGRGMSALWRGDAPMPGLPELRAMTTTQLDAVMALEVAVYPFPWSRGNFIDSLAAGYAARLLCEPRGGLLGYFVAMPGVEEMHLLNITVAPSAQGRGHARAMFTALLAEGRRVGARELWLEVRVSNAHAMAIYAHLGFAEVGHRKGYYPAAHGRREDAVVMSRSIPSASEGDDALE